MMECVDGDYQTFKSQSGAYVREHFFGRYPELLELVAHMSDDDIWALARGGHDPQKVFAAYQQAVNTRGRPTVILAKTVKGFGMGEAGEGQNINHQLKKMSADAVRAFRDRFNLPVSDEQLEDMPYLRPEPGSPEAPTSPSAAASRAASCRRGWRRSIRCRCRRCRSSTPSCRAAAIAANPPPWASCASSPAC